MTLFTGRGKVSLTDGTFNFSEADPDAGFYAGEMRAAESEGQEIFEVFFLNACPYGEGNESIFAKPVEIRREFSRALAVCDPNAKYRLVKRCAQEETM